MTDTPNTNHSHDAGQPDIDPSLTAFALGELEPGSDVYKQIEARLETDAQAKAFVEQTRTLGEQLGDAYNANDAASSGLSEHQQKELATMIDQQDNTPAGPITPPKQFWLSRPALIAAGLALAAGAAFMAVNMMGPDEPSPIVKNDATGDTITGIAKIGETLAEPIAVDFDNAPLSEVFAFLNKQTRVTFDTDWDSLGKRGINAQTPVTLKSDELIPAGRVLSAALQAAWSQSQHPDPAQWTMTDAGVTVAPQSALVEARLQATAALLKSDRLSPTPLDKRVLTADRAEVWESDLWNKVMAQRDQAGVAVLAEADAALDAADAAIAADELDRAAYKAMYAYQLISANNTLLKTDQFEVPAERYASLRQTITQGQRQKHDAAFGRALEEAKKRYTTESADETKTRLQAAAQLFKHAEQAQGYGQFGAAIEGFENALLLYPENTQYAERLAQVRDQISETQSIVIASDGTLSGRSARLMESLGGLESKLEAKDLPLPALSVTNNQPFDTRKGLASQTRGGISPKKSGKSLESNHFYALRGKTQNQNLWQQADSAPGAALRYQALAGKVAPDSFGFSDNGGSNSLGIIDSKVITSLEEAKKEAIYEPSRDRYGRDDALNRPVATPQFDNEGKPISRRAALQGQLDDLVKEKPLPQLDEETKQRYEMITIALDDARQFEPHELKRRAAVHELDELNPACPK
ncbi:MAG: hypothetical protein AB8C95_03580, partial [Phycisphaeraceae bacterium]